MRAQAHDPAPSSHCSISDSVGAAPRALRQGELNAHRGVGGLRPSRPYRPLQRHETAPAPPPSPTTYMHMYVCIHICPHAPALTALLSVRGRQTKTDNESSSGRQALLGAAGNCKDGVGWINCRQIFNPVAVLGAAVREGAKEEGGRGGARGPGLLWMPGSDLRCMCSYYSHTCQGGAKVGQKHRGPACIIWNTMPPHVSFGIQGVNACTQAGTRTACGTSQGTWQ